MIRSSIRTETASPSWHVDKDVDRYASRFSPRADESTIARCVKKQMETIPKMRATFFDKLVDRPEHTKLVFQAYFRQKYSANSTKSTPARSTAKAGVLLALAR
jgi:hypothetical protein